MPDPDPLSMFDNIYADANALVAGEREQFASYLSSFAEEDGR
jgi:pyruvate dehydrogenase E1 component alpha subunit